MSDVYNMAGEAETLVASIIQRYAPNLSASLDFMLSVYDEQMLDDEDFDEEDRGWAGMYITDSVHSPTGANVYLNVDHFGPDSLHEMIDTITHELGHAIWELLDADAQEDWYDDQDANPRGPGEAFADDFMNLMNGSEEFMNNEDLFRTLVGRL